MKGMLMQRADFHPQVTCQDLSNETEKANYDFHEFKKACDSADCGTLIAIPRESGINNRSIALTQQILTDSWE